MCHHSHFTMGMKGTFVFEGEHFHTWQVKLKFSLMKKGLWNLVLGNETHTNTRTGDQWVSHDEKAQAIIALNLGNDFIHHLEGKTSAKDMWETLDTILVQKQKQARLHF